MQMTIDYNLIKLIASVIGVVLSGYFIFRESGKRNKFLAILICLWAASVSVENFFDYFFIDKHPDVVFHTVDQEYDKEENPTKAHYNVKFINNGEEKAYNCSAVLKIFIDDELVSTFNSKVPRPIMEPGIIYKTQFAVDGKLLKDIWAQKVKMTVAVIITYYNNNGKEYNYEHKMKFKPNSGEKGLEPSWGPA